MRWEATVQPEEHYQQEDDGLEDVALVILVVNDLI
jgi:hypothetical protein